MVLIYHSLCHSLFICHVTLNIDEGIETKMSVRSTLFWDITQLEWQNVTDGSGQSVCPIFKGQEVLTFLTLEDWTDMLSRIVAKGLPLESA
jgi:hypothetical protein